MKHMIFVVLVLLPTLAFAKCGCKELRNAFYADKIDCKTVVFEDKTTEREYKYFKQLLKEYEEGTDSYVEIEWLLTNEFIKTDHPDYVEISMSAKLRANIENGESLWDED